MTEPEKSPRARRAIRRFGPLAVIAAALGSAYVFGLQDIFSIDWLADQRETLTGLIAEHYAVTLIGFAVLYAVAVATAFPAASVLTIGGGFLFGWLVAGLVVAVSATVGATILFLVARTSFGAGLRALAGPRVDRLADAFESNAFSTMIVLRLAPVFPFFVMNIAPALFRVPVATYAAATLIGILPGTFAYTYLGSGIESVLITAEAAGESVEVADLVTPQLTLAFAALALVAALSALVRRFLPRKVAGRH